MQTHHWVYISEDTNGLIHTRFTSEIDNILLCALVKGHSVVYLYPFNTPFEALAHKHMIEDLSHKTVKAIIKREKIQTQIRLKMILSQI